MSGAERCEPSSEGGYTLVELLIAMLISSMVLAMAGAFFINVAELTNTARTTRNGMGQASLAVDAVRNVVTMASDNAVSDTASTQAIVSATGTVLTVTSYANTVASTIAPTKVTFALDSAGYLSESRTAGALASGSVYWTFTGSTTTRRVAGPFVTGSGTPFFSYVDSSGAILTPPATGLITADLVKVAFVRITAKVDNQGVNGVADPVVVTSSIGLTNVNRDVDALVSLPALTGGL